MRYIYVVMAKENAYEPSDYPHSVWLDEEKAVAFARSWPPLEPPSYGGYRPEVWRFPVDAELNPDDITDTVGELVYQWEE